LIVIVAVSNLPALNSRAHSSQETSYPEILHNAVSPVGSVNFNGLLYP
jgi:hypothetical protein